MAEPKQPSFLEKLLSVGEVAMDRYIAKARSEIAQEEDEAFYRKSVYRDINYQVSSQGYLDRGAKLGFAHQRQMALKNTIVSGVIQTRQNQVAAHSKPVKEQHLKGWRIVLKDEEAALEKIKEELFGATEKPEEASKAPQKKDAQDLSSESEANMNEGLGKAEGDPEQQGGAEEIQDLSQLDPSSQPTQLNEPLAGDDNEDGDLSDREKDRLAREELEERIQKKRKALQDFVTNCGYLEDRPFESMKWDFDAWLRATVRDSLTYDQYATEFVPDKKGDLHHFVPVDGSTIRYTTPEFSGYRGENFTAAYDILYPEKELEALQEQRDALTLDGEKLKEGDYKYVQVVRGKIERAFTPEELSLGMRNPTADLYANGYSISELELLIGVVTSHIFTENYNHSYFSQGFSAKGILHIKAPLNRRKLETLRIQWRHMVSGNRNSFQTPILAGMDEVQWIPLTQNHTDMEFSNWMNYLIKVICSIYQIDPSEIGFGMRDEGGRGGGLSGDNTQEKMRQSKDRGLVPLLRHVENFITKNVIDRIDSDFKFEFTGVESETPTESVDRQMKEVKFKKSVNEIRAEDGLPPIKGADDLILDPTYMQWFTQFHPDGKKVAQQNQLMGLPGPGGAAPPGGLPGAPEPQETEEEEAAEPHVADGLEGPPGEEPEVKKSLSKERKIAVEYYTLKE